MAFAGGDGTARDIHAALSGGLPILGIPAGVKLRSAVFAPTPARAGAILAAWLEAAPGAVPLREAELVDIDPADLAADRPVQRLYGKALVPAPRSFVPTAKAAPLLIDEAALDGLARELAAEALPGRLYLYGPGATTRQVLHAQGIDGGTLLGVDAVRDGRLDGRDLSESAILGLLERVQPPSSPASSAGRASCSAAATSSSGRASSNAWAGGILVVAGIEKLTALRPPQLISTPATGGRRHAGRLDPGAHGPGRSTLVRVVT